MSLFKDLKDLQVDISDFIQRAFYGSEDNIDFSKALSRLNSSELSNTISEFLVYQYVPYGLLLRLHSLMCNEELLDRFVYTVLTPSTLKLHRHMILPDSLYARSSIPMCLIHSLNLKSGSITVERSKMEFLQDLIPYNNLYLGTGSLSEIDRWNIVESYLWGMNIHKVNSKLSPCFYVLLNNAALMGFINKELVFATDADIYEKYLSWFEFFKECQNDEMLQNEFISKLKQDEFSQYFGEGMSADVYGLYNSSLSKHSLEGSYYDVYGFLYGFVKEVEDSFKDDTSLWQFQAYRNQGFMFLDRDRISSIQNLCKRVDYPIDIDILLNPSLSQQLVVYLVDKLNSAYEALLEYKLDAQSFEYCMDRILYSVYSLAHTRYNNLSSDLLDVVYQHSFEKKYTDIYGNVAYGSVIEIQNKFSAGANIYLQSMLKQSMHFPVEFDRLFDKYYRYSKVFFAVISLLKDDMDYETVDKLMTYVLRSSDPMGICEQLGVLQKLLDSCSDYQGITVIEFLIALEDILEIPEESLIAELRRCFNINGILGFATVMHTLNFLIDADIDEDLKSRLFQNSEWLNSVMRFIKVRLYKKQQFGNDILESLLRLEPYHIDLLEDLTYSNVDVDSYLQLPVDKLNEYVEIINSSSDAMKYISIVDSSKVFELVSKIQFKTQSNGVLPLQDLNSLGDYSVYVTDLLESSRISVEQIFDIGYDGFTWCLLCEASNRFFNFKDLLRSNLSALSDSKLYFTDKVALAEVKSGSDLLIGNYLREYNLDQGVLNGYMHIAELFSSTYVKAIPFVKNIQKGFNNVQFDAVVDACSEIIVGSVPQIIESAFSDRYSNCVYSAVETVFKYYSFRESNLMYNYEILRVDSLCLEYIISVVESFCLGKIEHLHLSDDIVEASKMVARYYNQGALSMVRAFVLRIYKDSYSDRVLSAPLDMFEDHIECTYL